MSDIAPVDFAEWTAALLARDDVGTIECGPLQDPIRLVRYATRLFSQSDEWTERHTPRQIRVALNRLLHDWGLPDAHWGEDVAWADREACIESMVCLFEHVFAKSSFEEMSFMWWDALRCFEADPDPRVRDAMFAALRRILYCPEEHCHWAALHGLGHLTHSSRTELIQQWLGEYRNLSPSLREYAQQAANGTVL